MIFIRNSFFIQLFSLNIDNYPSYLIALEQLRDLFSCEPISINAALIKVRIIEKQFLDVLFSFINLGSSWNKKTYSTYVCSCNTL
jgi:hypothetical protein